MKSLLSILLLIASPELCPSSETIAQQLNERFGEVRAMRMVDFAGQLVEIFVGPEGSWTLVVTDNHECASIRGTGEGFEAYLPIKPGKRS